MKPGPDKVVACPGCGSLSRVFTLMSGNTLGARQWTDGKVEAQMLPEAPFITRCAGCRRFYWLADAQVLGHFYPWGYEPAPVPAEWKAAPQVRELKEEELLEALRQPPAPERELRLRIAAWWAGNDRFRKPLLPAASAKRSPEAERNLAALERRLGTENPAERLMKAEALRELGRFREALTLLEMDYPADLAPMANLIRRLAQKRDPAVRELPE